MMLRQEPDPKLMLARTHHLGVPAAWSPNPNARQKNRPLDAEQKNHRLNHVPASPEIGPLGPDPHRHIRKDYVQQLAACWEPQPKDVGGPAGSRFVLGF
jgi:hypothetical protein